MFIKTKKSLGQNFLKSKGVVKDIIRSANLKENDIVLEVGPGKGFLTEELLKVSKKVIVVEKDDRLISFLNEKFNNFVKNGNLEIIHQDILEFDIKNIKKPYKLVANIPYYITGQIIKKFLNSESQPEKMVLMVQKEVVKRIVDEKESILSISVKVYGKPKYITKVKAENFNPKPKVDSSILLISDISKDFFKKDKKIDEKDFFSLVKAGFSHKRKLLINNILSDWEKRDKIFKKDLENILEKLKINLKIRSENINTQNWKKMYIEINKIVNK